MTSLSKNKLIILYGASLAAALFLLKWLELRFIVIDYAIEIYMGAVALIFTVLGIWLAVKLIKPKIETVIVEKEVYINASPNFELNEAVLFELNLSKREMEVLELMSAGMSNLEIAGKLFVSLNTIKTHSSNLFEKLEVKRRTQAIEKAKRLNLIP